MACSEFDPYKKPGFVIPEMIINVRSGQTIRKNLGITLGQEDSPVGAFTFPLFNYFNFGMDHVQDSSSQLVQNLSALPLSVTQEENLTDPIYLVGSVTTSVSTQIIYLFAYDEATSTIYITCENATAPFFTITVNVVP